MRRSGAIPLAVTNVSELCMWMESANTVYGRTNNPYHTGRCFPHAHVYAHAHAHAHVHAYAGLLEGLQEEKQLSSPLLDLPLVLGVTWEAPSGQTRADNYQMSSVRMPAFFNGIFGHKPSTGIVDNGGGLPLARGKIDTYLCTGPLARSYS